MYIDYENCRVYFSKEEVDHLFKKNPSSNMIYCYCHVNMYASKRLLLSNNYYRTGMNGFALNTTINFSVDKTTNKLCIEKTYYVESFDFIENIISEENNHDSISIDLNPDKGQKYIIKLNEKYINFNIDFNEQGLLFTNICCSANNKTTVSNIYTLYRNSIRKRYWPLNRLLGNTPSCLLNSNSIFDKFLKKDALHIAYYWDGNTPIYDVKYASKHKFREIIYLKDLQLDYKHLLVETKSHLKILSTMFVEQTAMSINNYIQEQILEDEATFEIVTGVDIKKYYLYKNYYRETGDLGNSCMKKEDCQEKLNFYTVNPNISMLVLLKGDKIVGRALLWKTKNNEIVMDRIYTCHDRHNNRFIEYAKANNIEFIYDYNPRKGNNRGYAPANFTFEFSRKFEVELSEESCQQVIDEVEGALRSRETTFNSMPYFDNFCFLDPFTRTISNVNFFDSLGYKECNYSHRWFFEENLVLLKGKYYHKQYCVTSTRGNLGLRSHFYLINNKYYESEDVCIEYFYGGYTPKEDCVINIKTGDYIRKSDILRYIIKKGSFSTLTHYYCLDNLDNIVCKELPNTIKESVVHVVQEEKMPF